MLLAGGAENMRRKQLEHTAVYICSHCYLLTLDVQHLLLQSRLRHFNRLQPLTDRWEQTDRWRHKINSVFSHLVH